MHQHIAAVYNIHPPDKGGASISASLRDGLNRLLDSHMLFGGRDEELRYLNAFVEQHDSGYLFVTALSGYGKTALLANWVRTLQQDTRQVCYHFINRFYGTTAKEDLSLRNLCQQLTAYHDLRGALPASTSELRSLYPCLLNLPAAEGQKLVVVLDGLDEAQDWAPGPDLFPESLPKGVFVVFSAREIAGRDWLNDLQIPFANRDVLKVTTLGMAEIARLLHVAGGAAAMWAENDNFVAAIYKNSGGDPFYLRYLVEDIRDERIRSLAQLLSQPSKLKGYLDKWWQEVSQAVSEKSVSNLLGYLLVARGRITRDDLTNISADDELDGFVFENTLERLRRFVVGNDDEGYALCHPRFQDYLITNRIKASDQKPYRDRILRYCADWKEHMSRYALSHFAGHLADAGRFDSLYNLVRDQRWISARIKGGDAAPLLEDFDLAIQAARDEDPPNLEIVVWCCLAYGRHMTTAPPVVIDVLASAGQLGRAALIADNISYPLDRCQAFCFLAERNALGDPERARRQIAEARRSASAVLGSYRAMTSYWVAHAAIALEDRDTAQQVARTELCRTQLIVQRELGERPAEAEWWEEEQDLVQTIMELHDQGEWELPKNEFDSSRQMSETLHALFWTAMALREVEDRKGLERIRQLLHNCSPYALNLRLQTAAVAGETAYFDLFLPWRGGELPNGPGGILLGNLALALATAGRFDDAIQLINETRSIWERPGNYMADSGKRLAWALALCGLFEDSFAYIRLMLHPEERLRALFRVTQVLMSQGRQADLAKSGDLAEHLLAENEKELKRNQSDISLGSTPRRERFPKKRAPTAELGRERWHEFAADFWRLRSWASWILAAAGRMDRALEIAEAVLAEEIYPGKGTSLAQPTRTTEMAKQHVTATVGPNADERAMEMALTLAGANKLDEAFRVAESITSMQYRARARVGVAVRLPNKLKALDHWLSAVSDARRVGERLVIEVLESGKQILEQSAQAKLLEDLVLQTSKAATLDNRSPADKE